MMEVSVQLAILAYLLASNLSDSSSSPVKAEHGAPAGGGRQGLVDTRCDVALVLEVVVPQAAMVIHGEMAHVQGFVLASFAPPDVSASLGEAERVGRAVIPRFLRETVRMALANLWGCGGGLPGLAAEEVLPSVELRLPETVESRSRSARAFSGTGGRQGGTVGACAVGGLYVLELSQEIKLIEVKGRRQDVVGVLANRHFGVVHDVVEVGEDAVEQPLGFVVPLR